MSKRTNKKSRRRKKVTKPSFHPKQSQLTKEKGLSGALLGILIWICSHRLIIWATVTTLSSGLLTYIQLLPDVDLAFVEENRLNDYTKIPLRVTNNGLFDIEITYVIGFGAPLFETRKLWNSMKECGKLAGFGYTASIKVESGSSYDLFYNYRKVPGFNHLGAVMMVLHYKVPFLLKKSHTSSVLHPMQGKSKDIIWLSGNLRDFPECDPQNLPKPVM